MAKFQGLVTVTLDQVIPHTVMHHSSTPTYIPNITEIKETFYFLWTDGRTNVRTGGYLRPTLLGHFRGVDLKTE